jgi:hypothetical protein
MRRNREKGTDLMGQHGALGVVGVTLALGVLRWQSASCLRAKASVDRHTSDD